MATYRQCVVDGKTYEYCGKCGSKYPEWMFLYCCESCKDIKHIWDLYRSKKAGAKETANALKKYDISNVKEYIKKDLNEAIESGKPVITKEVNTTVVLEENSEPIFTERKPERRYQRNLKTVSD